jgi:hypothetical protein
MLHIYLEGSKQMRTRGMIMIGALVREAAGTGILKIVTGYRCDAASEWIQFAGETKAWHELTRYEILSDGH